MDYNCRSHVRQHQFKINNNRKRLTQEQVWVLETSFSLSNKLDSGLKSQLSQELGVPPRQVAIWYQNKRARWKNQSLEVDHKALQERLESVLADNKRLDKEVQRLREELNKSREMLISLNTPYSSLSSTSCDEAGSFQSSLGNSNHQLDKDFFACLIGDGSQLVKSDEHGHLLPPSIY